MDWIVIFVALGCFTAGRLWEQRSAEYKGGKKLVEEAAMIIERRKFIGDDVAISTTRKWNYLGYDYECVLTQSKEDL